MRHVIRSLRSSVLAIATIVFHAGSPCCFGSPETPENVIETVDVARQGDCLLVPVVLGDKTFLFLVDSGAAISVLDTALKPYLDPTPDSVRIDDGERKRFRLQAGFVGKSRMLLNGDATCRNLAQIREAAGYDIRGILGMAFLKAHVVRVDFDAGKLSFLKVAPPSSGNEFRLSFNRSELPLINVDIAIDETVALIVDTGKIGSALAFRTYVFDDLVTSGRLELIGPPALSTTVAGDKMRRWGRLHDFRLGEFRHERIKANEADQHQMGLGLLSKYIVTIDFPNSRLYLTKGKRFDEPDTFGLSGLVLGRINDRTLIQGVLEKSPADEAGLKVGDEILRVDGNHASSMTLFEIRSLLRKEGRLVRLDINGSAGHRKVNIRVSDPEQSEATPPKLQEISIQRK